MLQTIIDHSYESAPATKMLATHCALCGRDLVDAESVEKGIGPICRKKYGYDLPVESAARQEANALIYKAALEQRGIEVLKAAERLVELGFLKIAKILKKRAQVKVQVKITLCPAIAPVYYRLEAPYNAEAVAKLKAIPGRQYNEVKEKNENGKEERHCYNFIPTVRRQTLFDIISEHYKGLTAEGPKGLFEIK